MRRWFTVELRGAWPDEQLSGWTQRYTLEANHRGEAVNAAVRLECARAPGARVLVVDCWQVEPSKFDARQYIQEWRARDRERGKG